MSILPRQLRGLLRVSGLVLTAWFLMWQPEYNGLFRHRTVALLPGFKPSCQPPTVCRGPRGRSLPGPSPTAAQTFPPPSELQPNCSWQSRAHGHPSGHRACRHCCLFPHEVPARVSDTVLPTARRQGLLYRLPPTDPFHTGLFRTIPAAGNRQPFGTAGSEHCDSKQIFSGCF